MKVDKREQYDWKIVKINDLLNHYAIIFYLTKDQTVSHIDFFLSRKERILRINFVFILEKYRGFPKLHNYMCQVFSDFYYENYNNFSIEFIFLDQRFQKMIKRKVSSGKLPKQVQVENYDIEKKIISLELTISELTIEKEKLDMFKRCYLLDKYDSSTKYYLENEISSIINKINYCTKILENAYKIRNDISNYNSRRY
ncbi:hypothetical protein [Bacillus norwichensis]|uniref:Uncharacterized protein n=1 Tax=Bacillus norwichensis TaxID=2762217 RepID=A0ABR8VND0_9BACI|nr:hypothetical protein [Bacillus norwichensis]MBD8006269.1 hypothetical protein [Bacillus norwichensis]